MCLHPEIRFGYAVCQDGQVSSRPYAGVAAETRRAERRAALLEAALDLLGTQGLHATTLRALYARTGLNQRYFYESFTDLDALLGEVYDRIVTETAHAAARAIAATPPDADLRAKVQAAATAILDLGGADPRKIRVALVEATAGPALRARRKAALRHYTRLIIHYVRATSHTPEPLDEARLEFTATFLVAGWSETLIAWLDGTIPATAADLAAMFADTARALATTCHPPTDTP